MKHIAGRASVLLLLGLAAQCERGPQSATLSLSLSPGMERTMEFTTQENIKGAPDGSGSFSLSLTYKFRILSVQDSGAIKMECSVTHASVSKGFPGGDEFLQELTRKPRVITMDKNGVILDEGLDRFLIPRLQGEPAQPGAPSSANPASGDMETLFGGLNGRKVTVGETWTSPVPSSFGSEGTCTWTLSSLSKSTATVNYSGKTESDIPLESSPAGGRLSGDVSGYIVIDTATGWPVQGRSVSHITAALPESADTISLDTTVKFDSAR